MHTYIDTYIQTDRQSDRQKDIHIHTYTYIYIYIHTYIHTYIHKLYGDLWGVTQFETDIREVSGLWIHSKNSLWPIMWCLNQKSWKRWSEAWYSANCQTCGRRMSGSPRQVMRLRILILTSWLFQPGTGWCTCLRKCKSSLAWRTMATVGFQLDTFSYSLYPFWVDLCLVPMCRQSSGQVWEDVRYLRAWVPDCRLHNSVESNSTAISVDVPWHVSQQLGRYQRERFAAHDQGLHLLFFRLANQRSGAWQRWLSFQCRGYRASKSVSCIRQVWHLRPPFVFHCRAEGGTHRDPSRGLSHSNTKRQHWPLGGVGRYADGSSDGSDCYSAFFFFFFCDQIWQAAHFVFTRYLGWCFAEREGCTEGAIDRRIFGQQTWQWLQFSAWSPQGVLTKTCWRTWNVTAFRPSSPDFKIHCCSSWDMGENVTGPLLKTRKPRSNFTVTWSKLNLSCHVSEPLQPESWNDWPWLSLLASRPCILGWGSPKHRPSMGNDLCNTLIEKQFWA